MKKRSLSTSQQQQQQAVKKSIQLLLHATDGIAPYLTPFLLKKYFPAPQRHLLFGISVPETCLRPIYVTPNSVKPCGYEFVHQRSPEYMKDYQSILVPSFDLLQDASKRNQTTVQATEDGIGVWSLQGRQTLTNRTYLKLTSDIDTSSSSTSAIVSLFDQAATDHPKLKQQRSEQACRRTKRWCHELLSQCPTSNCKSIWAAINFHIPSSLETSLKYPLDDDILMKYDEYVSGYAIVGWGTSSLSSSPPAWLTNVTTSSKSVAVLSVTSLSQILDCLMYNINVIGTNLPTMWSKHHQAFVLPLNFLHPTEKYDDSNTSFLLDMSDSKFARDESPLFDGCECMACQNHSKAYIHHLYQAKELLAQILLMSHNLHRMLEFCRVATDAQESDQMDLFIRHCKKCMAEP